ncbi:hypothetical protein T4D_8729 [Trichinella pseudospiralis]|uniref:Uncharacterized protein n=1 Tax=Trichinella pseudospiralis TaxID=6337 RepID=A0A0V1FP71_TRIPS|nr:hypothetical protein T4D_8729 [Trichinella pseudospiralis]
MNIIPSIYHMIRIKKYPFDHLCFMLILTFLTTADTLFSGIIYSTGRIVEMSKQSIMTQC